MVLINQPTSFSFTVGPADGPAISTNGISLVLNGVTITSGLNFTQVGGNWVVTYAIQSNAVYTAVINVTNASGDTLSTPYTVNFDTFSQNNFIIEAEDFDFNGGPFIDNPVPTRAMERPLAILRPTVISIMPVAVRGMCQCQAWM